MDLEEVKAAIVRENLTTKTNDEFMAAAERAKTIPTMTQENQLILYGLYKQGTVGDINTPQPYFFNVTDTLKWNAWKRYETLSTDQAMTAYVYVVDQLVAGKPLKP